LSISQSFLRRASSLLIAIVLVSTSSVSAQTDPSTTINWRSERAKLDRPFAERLQEIGKWCRDNDLPQQIRETYKLYQPRDLQRQTIFLPTEKSMPNPPGGPLGEWLTKVNEVRVWQGEQILALASRAADAGAAGVAVQLLNEVLHFNRDHAEVRKMLGHRKTDTGWRTAPDRIKVSIADRNHKTCNWPAGSYLKVISPHFEIESNASKEQTIYLAEKLERWNNVWRQVFFDYWGNARIVQSWLEGRSNYRHSRKRFHVIFFKDRQDYIAQLAPLVRGLELSMGYYSNDTQTSYFFDDPDRSVEDTWRHELTHQLFRETISTGDKLFDDGYFWLDEGIATYFESLADFGDHVTLGGFESRRMQYARVRLMLEGYYVPLKKLSTFGTAELQSDPDLARLYSQLAGLTDMLMNDRNGASEAKLGEFLQLLYKGRKIRDGVFEELLGSSYEELDARYKEYLRVDPKRLARYLSKPLERTELSLVGAKLTTEAFQKLGECHNLLWLDLSQNQISPSDLDLLGNCQQIQQMFLTGCPLEIGALEALQQFRNLAELDLSGSSVSDEQLQELVGMKSLKTLKLTTTRVTDAGIAKLKRNLPGLEITK